MIRDENERVHADRATLEILIDRYGLRAVVSMTADVAGEKAEHIRATWQDSGLAKRWDGAARAIEHASGLAPLRYLDEAEGRS